ncbi:TonB-dependent receptor plug domain-containing protein [Luteolibacter algae]|uniref:TonB-dependent receptor plug domain-containing protein n=1 Tax=Luteolibacter algae TaxID=454151 RepID=A0ABW5D6U6_9BACT
MKIHSTLYLCLTFPLVAQNYLEPLVLTATRSEIPLSEAAYSVESFGAEDFLENTVRTLPDALRYTPGVLVQKTAYGHGSPYIRGFTGRQNLLLVDGVRFNNSTFRGGPVQYWNTLDTFSLDRFELIRSQGSVLYGSDAAGGTLNAFTKSADFQNEQEGEVFSHGSAYYEYRSNGRGSHLGRLETQTGIGGKFGLHLGVSAKEFGDIEDSAVGLMRGTGYPEQAIDARIDYAIDTRTTLTFLHQNFNQDNVSRWHSTRDNPGWTHGSSYTLPGSFIARDIDQERSLSYLRFTHENDQADALIRRVTGTLSYQTSSETEFQIRTLTDLRRQSYEVDTLGLDLELESAVAGGALVYGVDYYHDSIDSTASRNRGSGFAFDITNRPVADDSSYDLFGAYAQYIRPIGEKWELTGGVRFTHASADLGKFYDSNTRMDHSASDSWDDVSASLRAIYKVDDKSMIFGGLSQAFRAPNLNDLSGNLTSRSGMNSTGSLEVEPEEFLTAELGYRENRERSGYSASIFYTHVSDVITGVPVVSGSGTTVTTNGSDGYVYGVELEGYWEIFPQWTLSGFAAWQEGRTETPAFIGGPEIDEYFSRLLPLSGSLALRWDHASMPVWIEGRLLASAEADRLSSGDRGDTQRIPVNGTPAYAVVSMRAGYNPTEKIQLTAAVENMLDDDYRLHGSGQNEPGVNAIIGAKYIW